MQNLGGKQSDYGELENRELQSSQEKSKKMVMQTFGGETRCIVVHVKTIVEMSGLNSVKKAA